MLLLALSELSDVSTASAPGDVVPPKFTQLLKDIESNEGEKVTFDCRVIGHPAPAVKWYRGRQQVQNSADFQVVTLVISVYLSNTLKRKCRAVQPIAR